MSLNENNAFDFIQRVKPWQYMFSLTTGNIFTSLVFTLPFIVRWLFLPGSGERKPAAALASILVLSINNAVKRYCQRAEHRVPGFINGIVGLILYFLGVFHSLLRQYPMCWKVQRNPLRTCLWLIPNFSEVQRQASNILLSRTVDIVPVLVQLLFLYIVLGLTFLPVRKEVWEMKKFLIVYGLIGIILVTLLICFSSTELPEINQTLYIQATQLSDRVTEEIWPGYSFKSYPVAIRKGNTDYVFHGDKCIKRKAALPIIAATAYKHEGEINIFMPSKADMDSLGQIAEGLSESQEQFFITGFALDKEGISDNRYVAILFHEGLHAYQLEHFKDNLFNAMPDSSHNWRF